MPRTASQLIPFERAAGAWTGAPIIIAPAVADKRPMLWAVNCAPGAAAFFQIRTTTTTVVLASLAGLASGVLSQLPMVPIVGHFGLGLEIFSATTSWTGFQFACTYSYEDD